MIPRVFDFGGVGGFTSAAPIAARGRDPTKHSINPTRARPPMFDSQTITMQDTTSTVLYSPWFPRGGDYGIFTMEMTSLGGSVTLAVAMVSKNTSETGDPASPVTTLAFQRTAVGRTSVDFANGLGASPVFAGFKELVRYKFTLSGGTAAKTSWATFRMHPPIWYDKV